MGSLPRMEYEAPVPVATLSMPNETNPYASPESTASPSASDQPGAIARTLRALTVGPALVLLVLFGLGNLFSPITFAVVIGALVLLHVIDRALFKTKSFFGRR